MNTLNFLKKAFVLSKGNPQKYKPELWATLSQAGSFRSAISLAASFIGDHRPLDANALTRNLNDRFGQIGLYILDSDSRSFTETFTKLHGLHAHDESFIERERGRLAALSRDGIKREVSNGVGGLLSSIASTGIRFYETARISNHLRRQDRATLPSVAGEHNAVAALLDMTRVKAGQSEMSGGIAGGKSMDSQQWFYLFAQELGQAVQSISSIKDYQDRMGGRGVDLDLQWLKECHAQIFSACLCARVTGNWDTLRTVILPSVALDGKDHDTFPILKGLMKVPLEEINSVSELELSRHAHWLMCELIDKASPEVIRSHSPSAAHSMQQFFSGDSALVDTSNPSVNKCLFERTQAIFDAFAVDSLVMEGVDSEGITGLRQWFEAIGFQDVADKLHLGSGLTAAEQAAEIAFFASEDIPALADRVNSNEFSVNDFIDDLKSPEMGYFNVDLPVKGSRAERESPALSGASL